MAGQQETSRAFTHQLYPESSDLAFIEASGKSTTADENTGDHATGPGLGSTTESDNKRNTLASVRVEAFRSPAAGKSFSAGRSIHP